MTRHVLIFLALLPSLVFAQPVITRGGALKKRQYQTYGAMTLYVDGALGSDSGACTSSGAGACATVNGALAKLPRFVRHNVTINVAAGTYSDFFSISDLDIGYNVTLTVAGTLATSTLATGSTTGTTTASAAGSNAGPGTFTDSGQSWTTNDLVGRFVTFTSGTLSGQTFPISANTGTVVTIPSTSAAGTGVAYTIQDAATQYPALASSGHTVQVTGLGNVLISNMKVVRTGGTGAGFIVRAGSGSLSNTGVLGVRFLNVYVGTTTGSSAGISAINAPAARLRLSNSFLSVSGTGNAVTVSSTTQSISLAVFNSVINVPGGGAALFFGAGHQGGSVNSTILSGAGTPTALMSWSSGTVAQNIGTWLTCTGGAGAVGLKLNSARSNTSAQPPIGFTANGSWRITGCETAVDASGPGIVTMWAPAFVNATYGVRVRDGLVFQMYSTPVYSTVTNEWEVDGVTYTDAFLQSLSPARITGGYLSQIIH